MDKLAGTIVGSKSEDAGPKNTVRSRLGGIELLTFFSHERACGHPEFFFVRAVGRRASRGLYTVPVGDEYRQLQVGCGRGVLVVVFGTARWV